MIKAVMTDVEDVTGKFDRTLLELWAGIAVAGILGQAVVFLVERKAYFTIGWWYGIMLSLFMAWHMWRALDRGLDMGNGASGYLTRSNIIRYVLVAVAYIALATIDFGNPVAAFAGVLMLKVAAYIQPFTHKVFKKMFGWVDVFPPGIPDEDELEMVSNESESDSREDTSSF